MNSSLEVIVTSKTRNKLLLKFFLNHNIKCYLRGLTKEFDLSSNSVRTELNRFENAGLINSNIVKNKIFYTANTQNPIFANINNMVRETLGINQVIKHLDNIKDKLQSVWVTGELAKGSDSKTIDLVLVGKNINSKQVDECIIKIQPVIERKIIYTIETDENLSVAKNQNTAFIVWEHKNQFYQHTAAPNRSE